MSEEQTKDLPNGRSFEEQVLSQLGEIFRAIGALDGRLTTVEQRLVTLEDRVDARLRETRPIWEAVQASLERLDKKFDNVIRDLYDVRTDIRLHESRLAELERRINS